MLQLNDRQLILDALRTPIGYEFDCAVGTTYTLDLLALMQVTLAFAVRGVQDAEDNPIAKLSVLHRYVDKMTVFCDAGHISVPRTYIPLFSYFEDAIHEVKLENEGAFHPKIWCVRYTPIHRGSDPIRYTLLCLSRNITFDRSWDTVLTLSGTVGNAINNDQQQDNLSGFFQYLSKHMREETKEERKQQLKLIQNEIKQVKFEIPDGFDDYLKFHPILPKSKQSPFPKTAEVDQTVIISPFVKAEKLEEFRKIPTGSDWKLVTRPDSLIQEREEIRKNGAEIFVLSDHAELEGETSDNSLDGLHAKLYIFDIGNKTHLFTGSANATLAAFSKNVEFLVELHGDTSKIGTQQLFPKMDSAVNQSLRGILTEMSTERIENNDEQDSIDKQLDDIRRDILDSDIQVIYKLDTDSDEDTYTAWIQSDFIVPNECDVFVRLVSQPRESKGVNLNDLSVSMSNVALINLTSFAVFTIHLKGNDQTLSFVHQLPTTGIPNNRQSMIIRQILNNHDKILRFLMLLLLQDDEPAKVAEYMTNLFDSSASTTQGDWQDSLPLFEVMVKALDNGWTRLDEVNRLIDALGNTDGETSLIPEELTSIWKPIWEYRQQLREQHGH